MNDKIQVLREHYFNVEYNHKARWLSYYYQILLLKKYRGVNVLEVGPGHSWMRNIAVDLGIMVRTVDIDSALKPDYIASVDSLPVEDNTFDIVCAFEVLEHMPFSTLVPNVKEMARAARNFIIISLPDKRHILFHLKWKIPFMKYRSICIKISSFKKHAFDGQHYWEIGKRGYSPRRVKRELEKTGLTLVESFIPEDTPSNYYFILKK